MNGMERKGRESTGRKKKSHSCELSDPSIALNDDVTKNAGVFNTQLPTYLPTYSTVPTVVLEIIQPLSGKFSVFVSEKKDAISGAILKHYSYFSFLQSNNLFSKPFRPFLRLGQCS